jgi:hypothetical protein
MATQKKEIAKTVVSADAVVSYLDLASLYITKGNAKKRTEPMICENMFTVHNSNSVRDHHNVREGLPVSL